MLYDIRTTAAQLKAAADWIATDIDMPADVELVADDSMLLVEQGDDRAAFDTDGSPGSDEYLALAPLDPRPTGRELREKMREEGREEVRESVRMALRDAHRNDSAADAVEYVSDVVGWSADEDPELAESASC